MSLGARAMPLNEAVQRPVTLRIEIGNDACPAVALLSVTLATTVKSPVLANRCVGVFPLPAPPSPKSHATV